MVAISSKSSSCPADGWSSDPSPGSKVPKTLEKLRTETQHQPSDDPSRLPHPSPSEIVNRLLVAVRSINKQEEGVQLPPTFYITCIPPLRS